MMKVLLALGILVVGALGIDVCPRQVPTCPAKSEPRCFHTSRRYEIPGHTKWLCVLCETTRSRDEKCYWLNPIKTYATPRRDDTTYQLQRPNPYWYGGHQATALTYRYPAARLQPSFPYQTPFGYRNWGYYKPTQNYRTYNPSIQSLTYNPSVQSLAYGLPPVRPYNPQYWPQNGYMQYYPQPTTTTGYYHPGYVNMQG